MKQRLAMMTRWQAREHGLCLHFRDGGTLCGVTGGLTDKAIADYNAYQAERRVLSILKNAEYEANYVLDKERKPVALKITIPAGTREWFGGSWCSVSKQIEHLVVRPAQEPDGHLILTVESKEEEPPPPAVDDTWRSKPHTGFVM